MKAIVKPQNLPYRGEPTRAVRISDAELYLIETGQMNAKRTGRVALKGKRKQKNLTCQRITKPWTEEEDEMVASAYKSGKSVPEICAETGRTKDSVVHRLQKLSKTGAFEMRPRGKKRKEKEK